MYSLDPTPLEMAQKLALKHKALRRQLKMSQAEMAERSGVSLGSLKRFERTGKIALESLLKLMHLLGRLQEVEALLKPGDDLNEVKKLFSQR